MRFNEFGKEELETYLHELGVQYRKLTRGKVHSEIVLVGGAAILLGYSFRQFTNDTDALNYCESPIREAIRNVALKYDLREEWMNFDIQNTRSYSSNLASCSKLYKQIGKLQIRIVEREYLLAMKMMAGRNYKYDLSDIAGIIQDHSDKNDPISLSEVRKACIRLYGSYEAVDEESRLFVERILENRNLDLLYEEVKQKEEDNQLYLLAGRALRMDEKEKAGIIQAIEKGKSRER